MASRLNQLPSELIDSIASFLSEEDLLTIRFVSHALRSESESVFRRTFFTSRTTSLDMEDLNALLEVSRHPRFSGDIKTLTIDVRLLIKPSLSPCPLDFYEPRIIRPGHKQNLKDPHNQPLQEYRNALCQISKAQEAAGRVGLQTAVLTSILRNLPALSSIRVGKYRNSPCFKRVEKGWISAGMRDLVGNIRSFRYTMFSGGLGTEKVLVAMSASMEPLTSLVISTGFNPGSSTIPKHLPTALSYCLNSVSTLNLKLTHGEPDVDRLLSYLATMPKLQHLELDFRCSWGPAIELIGDRILWSNLTHCVLNHFTCTAEGLRDFVRKHVNTLREISICDCSLEQGGWRPIFFSIFNAAKAQRLEFHYCQPFPDEDLNSGVYESFRASGTPVEVSEAVSAFLIRF